MMEATEKVPERVTETLLYKLEEKMMLLLTDAEASRNEVEALRTEVEGNRQVIQRLQQENHMMKQDKENHTRKLQDLISLLDSVNPSEQPAPMTSAYAVKPVLVQG